MTAEEAIAFIEEQLLRRRRNRTLSEGEKLILQKVWEQSKEITYEEMVAGITWMSEENLRCNVAPKLWKLLSILFEQRVGKRVVRELIETKALELHGEAAPKALIEQEQAEVLVGCVPEQDFYGREEELSVLCASIQRNRIVLLYGFAGVGKTALAAQLYKQPFKQKIWKVITPGSTVKGIVNDILQEIGKYRSKSDPHGGVPDLIRYLEEIPSLLVLDCIGNESAAGLKSLLWAFTASEAESVLIITNREPLADVLSLERDGYPVKSQQVKGMKHEDGRKILAAYQLKDEKVWDQIIEIYRGNPLILKLVSSLIQEMFGGSVSAFYNTRTLWLGETTEQLLQEVFHPSRMQVSERQLLRCIAEKQGKGIGLKMEEILASMEAEEITVSAILTILQRMVSRAVIEQTESPILFRLQPIIQKFIIQDPAGYFHNKDI